MKKKSNPYFLETPCVISFSGGRTSGFMFRKILDVHDGELPYDAHVIFANTGLEHTKTYDFIGEVEDNWGVPVAWLEYCLNRKNQASFKKVDYYTADRVGTPYDVLLEKENYFPNPLMRICTTGLKIKTIKRYMMSLGYKNWTNYVGIRYDEPRRVHRILNRDESKQRHDTFLPMHYAKHTINEVSDFWTNCDFDLGFPIGNNMLGNCVGCFLKRNSIIKHIAIEEPNQLDWWLDKERLSGKRFKGSDGRSYAELIKTARVENDIETSFDSIDCSCTD